MKIDCSPAPQYSGSQAHAFTDGTTLDRKDIIRYLHYNYKEDEGKLNKRNHRLKVVYFDDVHFPFKPLLFIAPY